MRQRAAAGAGVALALFAIIAGRVVLSARSELRAGDEAWGKHDSEQAIAHYRRAGHWYAPGNPWSAAALDRLKLVARRAEMQGDLQTALRAYRAVRTSILGTRSFYTPHPTKLRSANRRIAHLMARLPRPPEDVGKPTAQVVREHLALLERDDSPSVGWSLVMLLGFGAWMFAAFRLIGRGLDAEGRIQGRVALLWGGVLLAGFGVFVLGLWLA